MSEVVSIRTLDEGIVQVRMDDPETRNGLSETLVGQLLTALNDLATKPDLKVLIITGTSRIFCSGATQAMLHQLCEGQLQVKDLLLPEVLIGFPVPTIAALEGPAIGGGLILALCCDITVAAETSRYGLTFLSKGFTPGMGTTWLLPSLVGHHVASEMLFGDRLYTGRELRDTRLFNHVVPAANIPVFALDLARRVAQKPRLVLELLKTTLAAPRKQMLEAALAQETVMHQICFSKEETRSWIDSGFWG